MKRAVFTGSFDPVTLGHLDLIERAADVFDELIVLVMVNDKKTPLFSIEEKVELLEAVTEKYDNVTISYYKGLVAQYVKENNIDVIVRGVRSVSDYEYEFQMAQTNRILSEGVDTFFLAANPRYSVVSSSMVKEIAYFGGDISEFVPEIVCERLMCKLK